MCRRLGALIAISRQLVALAFARIEEPTRFEKPSAPFGSKKSHAWNGPPGCLANYFFVQHPVNPSPEALFLERRTLDPLPFGRLPEKGNRERSRNEEILRLEPTPRFPRQEIVGHRTGFPVLAPGNSSRLKGRQREQ